MRVFFLAAVAAILAAPVFAGEIEVAGDTTVAPGDMAILNVASEGATGFYWTSTNHDRRVFDPLKNGSSVAFAAGTPGEYRWVVSVRDGEISEPVLVEIVVGDPPEPEPPGPNPPTPPDPPEPKPDDAPFPADGLSVLIVYETASQADLSSGQRAILFGAKTRELLESATEDHYRIFDADVDVSQAEEPWGAAMAVPRESLPWVVISDGETGTSRPLPDTPEAFAELLNTYQ